MNSCESFLEDIEWNEEFSIVSIGVLECILGLWSPLSSVLVAPSSFVVLISPWVSHSHELLAIVLGNSEDGVGMATDEVLWRLSICASAVLNIDSLDIVFSVPLSESPPQLFSLISSEMLGNELLVWHASQGVEGLTHPSSIEMVEVTVVLGEKLLQKRGVGRLLDPSILDRESTGRSESNLVIDGDVHWSSEHVHGTSHLSISWDVFDVLEHLLHSIGPLSKSSDGGKEPAVSHATLLDLVLPDATSPKGWQVGLVGKSLERNIWVLFIIDDSSAGVRDIRKFVSNGLDLSLALIEQSVERSSALSRVDRHLKDISLQFLLNG